MIEFLFWLIIFFVILYLYFAIYLKVHIAKLILKPVSMVLIIVLAIYGTELDTSFSRWVVIALFFSLLGDVFLMLKEKWFVHGLTSFLIAHLFYIIGFWFSYDIDFTTVNSVFIGVVLFALAMCFYLFLFNSVKKHGGTKLLIAVAFYISVISMMVWSACLVGIDILIIASLLFFVSDAVLAWNKFKFSFASAEYIVMSTYFSAQFFFAWSII